MLTTKLTLSADPAIISIAKETARRKHTSVSRMFAKLIEAMQDVSTEEIASITKRASGMVSLPEQKDDVELLEDALTSRYGCEL